MGPGLNRLSLVFTKASVSNGKLRWAAVCSDTGLDSYGDRATHELFQSFVSRAAKVGRMPYVSVAHHMRYEVPEHLQAILGADGAAGDVEGMYIDGETFKAKGTFAETPLGIAAYKSVYEDMSRQAPLEDRVRISIGFLDWAHRHSDGSVFYRKSLDEECPQCRDGQQGGVAFMDGELIHVALTRIPANPRTPIIVEDNDMGVKTRTEDSAEVVGDEIAKALDEAASASPTERSLIQRSEDEAVQEPTGGTALDPATLAAIQQAVTAAVAAVQPAAAAPVAEPAVEAPPSGEAAVPDATPAPASPVPDEYDAIGRDFVAALRSAATPSDIDSAAQSAALAARSLVARSNPTFHAFEQLLQSVVAPLVQQIGELQQRVEAQAITARSTQTTTAGQPPVRSPIAIPNPSQAQAGTPQAVTPGPGQPMSLRTLAAIHTDPRLLEIPQ